MPVKKPGMTPEEQSKRFMEAAIEADGGQSPIDVAERFDRVFRKLVPRKTPSRR